RNVAVKRVDSEQKHVLCGGPDFSRETIQHRRRGRIDRRSSPSGCSWRSTRAQSPWQDLVLETKFTMATGNADAARCTGDRHHRQPHELGAAPPRMLVRSLMCTAGEVEVSVELTPRPEYGIVTPMMSVIEGGILVRGGADILLLCCPTRLEVADSSATGRFRMQHG